MAPRARRLRWLVAIVAAVSAAAMVSVVVLQDQARDAHEKEATARIYSATLKQSIDELVPVGIALSRHDPDLLASLVHDAVQRSVTRLGAVRSIDPSRTHELELLVQAVQRVGVADSLAGQQAQLASVNRAAAIADEIARGQRDRAEAAELRALLGTGGALAFAILVILFVVLRERRRSVADAAAHAATVQHLAEHDPLTGLPNRRRFDADLALLVAEDGPVEIVMCDLNEFKAINDRLGHDAGDAVLITVGRDLQARIADAGTVYRTGGDEFAVLSAPGARIADLARQALERDESTSFGSVGAARFPADEPLARDAVRLADRRMYAAKCAVIPRATGPSLPTTPIQLDDAA